MSDHWYVIRHEDRCRMLEYPHGDLRVRQASNEGLVIGHPGAMLEIIAPWDYVVLYGPCREQDATDFFVDVRRGE